ncbi:purine nucleoside permease [Aspergillus egyptiacus]|nr:purine nucleoside permease [Aspergillus egyptiacus]
MRFSLVSGLLLSLGSLPSGLGAAVNSYPLAEHKITPKVFIISMFTPEAQTWHHIAEFNLLAHNITLPGLSPLFPAIHCTKNHEICQLTTGEGEINAAVTMTSLLLSDKFNLSTTYFLIAGIAGINPEIGTLASVTFARFAVQVALQHELDAREIPANFSTGYVPQGGSAPGQYPPTIYGTEVFELNADLREIAAGFARGTNLADSETAKSYRARYASAEGKDKGIYEAATKPPSILECDTSTSDVYFSGRLLGEAFSNTTTTLTSGKGVYCSTQQEDNATLEALLRGASSGLVDFGRIIIMRSASDFDRPYPGQTALSNMLQTETQGGFEVAVENLYRAGVRVVLGILEEWEERFEKGVKAGNYIGDSFGTLGGKPDFGADVVVQRGGKRAVGGWRGRR